MAGVPLGPSTPYIINCFNTHRIAPTAGSIIQLRAGEVVIWDSTAPGTADSTTNTFPTGKLAPFIRRITADDDILVAGVLIHDCPPESMAQIAVYGVVNCMLDSALAAGVDLCGDFVDANTPGRWKTQVTQLYGFTLALGVAATNGIFYAPCMINTAFRGSMIANFGRT